MNSFWENDSFFAPQDVIIIGSGVAGLWCAVELKKKNKKLKITILERGIIPTGASTRNAGFACFGSPGELLYDKQLFGEDEMLNIVEMRYKGIDKIKQNFDSDTIGFDSCGGFEVYEQSSFKNKNYNYFLDEVADLNNSLSSITKTKTTFLDTSENIAAKGLQGFSNMIENKLEGSLHSGKYIMALTQLAQSLGVQIITGITVTGWQKINAAITVNTNQQINFSTSQLIVCTNAFTNNLIKDVVTPGRGQIILTSPVKNFKLKGTFHFNEGYYYFRNVGDRILLGGARNLAFADETSTEIINTTPITSHLKAFIRKHILPEADYTIEHEWSGIMGFTQDKKPVVKKMGPNVTLALACNGMGVALSPVIAEKIAAGF